MANDPRFRDLSKLDYIPPFDTQTVARIQRIALISAVIAGLFGILYFSLAPAAMTTVVEVSRAPQSGQDCKMISAVSRVVRTVINNNNGIGVISRKVLQDLFVEVRNAGKSLELNTVSDQVEWSSFHYENFFFDTYEACLNSAKVHTTCKWSSSERWDLFSDNCLSYFVCSSPTPNGLMFLATGGSGGLFSFVSNATLLADPRYGNCNQTANVTACRNINENCDGLRKYIFSYQQLIKQYVLTPEIICRPFLKNPPYLCSRTSSVNVPSVLSQSFSFASTALFGVSTVCFFAVKLLRKVRSSKAKTGSVQVEAISTF